MAAEVTEHRIRAQRANGREARTRTPALASEVFDAFPYGILVVDRSGEVLAANPAATDIVGPVDDGHGHKLHSCALLGCGAPGPLAHVCLTDAALARGRPLPEIRLDLPAADPTGAAWVTAAPLTEDGSRIVIELRPGDAADRRRRTTPHWTAGAQLRVITLGTTRVESTEGPIGGRWLEQRPGQLLKYLLAERHRVVRAEEIAETIWPGSGLKILGNVRHFVHALRTRLEPERGRRVPSSFILNVQGGYALDRRHIYIDADDFEDHVHAGLDHLAEGHVTAARERLEHAMALYGGDFLADEPYADWAMPQRDLMRRLAADALRSLVTIARHEGDLEAEAAHIERLGDMEPFDTDVHREVISLCLQRGRRSEALRRYAALRVRILRTFGEDIDFALADLRSGGQETAQPDRTFG